MNGSISYVFDLLRKAFVEKGHVNLRKSFVILALGVSSVAARGQAAPITTPLLNILDFGSDTGLEPLLLVQGGATSSTLGVEVTSQSTLTQTSNLPPLNTIMGTGFGGLSLVQTGLANSTNGQDSPVFAMCAQQWSTGPPPPPPAASNPTCWYWQVKGGNGTDGQDILLLKRNTMNQTGNITMQVPGALNFAAGDGANGGQLTIGSVPSSAVDLSAKPVTIVGGFTTSNVIGPPSSKAGALQLFPGFLNSTTPNSNATILEGPLQIGMAVKGNQADGLLACYTTTAQTATACTDVKSALLGVYFTVGNGSTHGSNGVITPPGRAAVTSNSSTTWTAGNEVCRDPSNPSEAIAATSGACPLGQAVGVAAGDSGSGTSHLVDLDFSNQGVGASGYWSAGPLNSAGGVTVPSNNTESAYGFYIPSILVASKVVLDASTGDNSSDTYSFGIFNSSGTIVAHTAAQSFTTSPTVYVVSFVENAVTFPPGKYYFGYTGTGGTGSLVLIPFQAFLTPMVRTQVATGTGGTLVSFTPGADTWATSGSNSAAFALAP